MNRPIKTALVVGALALVAFTAKPVDTVVHSTQPTPIQLTAATSTATYYWHGINTGYCPDVYTEGCSGASLWWAQLHIAVWANGTDVVMATKSGYPWCDAQGYELTITACNWYSGGSSEVYAAVHWQNCVLLFSIGCFSDTLTVGINRYGKVNYWAPNWQDTYP